MYTTCNFYPYFVSSDLCPSVFYFSILHFLSPFFLFIYQFYLFAFLPSTLSFSDLSSYLSPFSFSPSSSYFSSLLLFSTFLTLLSLLYSTLLSPNLFHCDNITTTFLPSPLYFTLLYSHLLYSTITTSPFRTHSAPRITKTSWRKPSAICPNHILLKRTNCCTTSDWRWFCFFALLLSLSITPPLGILFSSSHFPSSNYFIYRFSWMFAICIFSLFLRISCLF